MSITDINIARAERAWHQYHESREAAKEARDDRLNAMEAKVAEGLRIAYLAGLNGINVFLPFAQHRPFADRDVERTQSVWDTVLADLDYPETAELLKVVMAESTCPLVHALKVALAERYVTNHAAELAELRSVE